MPTIDAILCLKSSPGVQPGCGLLRVWRQFRHFCNARTYLNQRTYQRISDPGHCMRALLILLVLVLAGCGTGPDETVLKKDIVERLTQALPAGTVALAKFDRRGSQSDTKAPAGETRRIIYFDAELKLEHDYDFGAWDSPGVA